MQAADTTRAKVREYYDRNTEAFLERGQGGDVAAIHRAVWGPGVETRAEAFHYLESCIIELVAAMPRQPDHIVDLGCGVGGSLYVMAAHLDCPLTGITLSPEQARIGRVRASQAGLEARLSCLEGDYCNLPPSLAPAQLAYAIESFLHVPDPDAFFGNAARLVSDQGLLVICDDFVRLPWPAGRAERWIRRFAEDWQSPHLMTHEHCIAYAHSHGFELEQQRDLSGYLELGRPRDWLIAAAMHGLGWLHLRHPGFQMLRGGHALQRCLQRGDICFRMLVFRRSV